MFTSPLIKIISIVIFLAMFFCSGVFAHNRNFPRGTHEVYIAQVKGVRTDLLPNITHIVTSSIAKGNYPGAIVLIGHKNQIIYKGVFGSRRILPQTAPMHFNTIFDIASLTKVVATAPAIMQLIEQGKLDLDTPAAKYWPEFATHGKDGITIRELLTHTSGLPADVEGENARDILVKICQLKLEKAKEKKFLYSDVNFIVLARIVERISHEPFDVYVKNHIYKILTMRDTFYLPAKNLRARIAPTELIHSKLRWGDVQDPLAHAMGGVSGNAGLFSTAADLNLYAQALLNGGVVPSKLSKSMPSKHFLGPLSIAKMTSLQTPQAISDSRGLGWDIDSRYSNRGVLFPVQSFGHTGWTGTSLWIDPVTKTWIIMLTSRAHPVAMKTNQLIEDRRRIANIVSASIVDVSSYSFNNTGKGELTRAYS